MAESKTIRRWYWVWEYDVEEQWLNEMAQQGWLLDKVSLGTYHFIPCEPGAYTIRLEMHKRDDEYIAFMRETGAEYIGRMMMWVFFRKATADGEFDLFSDIDSKLTHLRSIERMLTIVAGANLLIGIINSFNPTVHAGWINLLCATLLMYALGRIQGRIEPLKRARSLHE